MSMVIMLTNVRLGPWPPGRIRPNQSPLNLLPRQVIDTRPPVQGGECLDELLHSYGSADQHRHPIRRISRPLSRNWRTERQPRRHLP